MISHDVDGGASPLEVVMPTFEGIIDGCKVLIVYIIIGFSIFKSPGVECDWVVVAIRGSNGQYGS